MNNVRLNIYLSCFMFWFNLIDVYWNSLKFSLEHGKAIQSGRKEIYSELKLKYLKVPLAF